MRHRSNHAVVHATKGPTVFPIAKYLFFWLINGMGNPNSWCCSMSPQQWCILLCSTPTVLTVLGAPTSQAPQALLKALLENFPRHYWKTSQVKQPRSKVSAVKEAELSSTWHFARVQEEPHAQVHGLKWESLATNKVTLILDWSFSSLTSLS